MFVNAVRNSSKVKNLVALSALAILCGRSQPGGADGVRPPEGTPPGQLVAAGTNYVHSYDLGAGSLWQDRFEYDAASAAVTVDEPRGELIMAYTAGSEYVTVTVYDVGTFALKRTFEIPVGDHSSSVRAVAVSRDGRYMALNLPEFADSLVVLWDLETNAEVYRGLRNVQRSSFVFTPAGELLIPLHPLGENPAALVAFRIADLVASTDGNVAGTAVVTFTREEWGSGTLKPALSRDGSQLVYESQGSVWLIELGYEDGALSNASEPRRLTTGPEPSHGAALSPTGSHMAVTVGTAHLASTYIVPTSGVEPVLIDRNSGAGSRYLLQANTLVDYVLAWL